MSALLFKFVVLSVIALVSPLLVPGAKVKGFPAAASVAVVFGLLNLLIGWLLSLIIGILSLPAILLTFGVFLLVIPTLVNAVLLRLTDALLDSFELDGWVPALIMGFLFAVGGWLTS